MLGGEQSGGRLVTLGEDGEICWACDGAKRTCKAEEAMRAASLMALNANNSRKKLAVSEAAVRHVQNWKR